MLQCWFKPENVLLFHVNSHLICRLYEKSESRLTLQCVQYRVMHSVSHVENSMVLKVA